jgi:hypothetical protein
MRIVVPFVELLACAFFSMLGGNPAASTVAEEVFAGSTTISVTDDSVTIEDFEKDRFSEFVGESLRRYFKIGKQINPVPRATGLNSLQDVELIGPSKCLASTLSGSGWQKLRFEFSYRIDDVHLARTSRVRYQILVRLISGEVADFQLGYEPPADRFRQAPPLALTDLATKLAGFIKEEMTKQCFDRHYLRFCSTPGGDIC